MLPSMTLLGFLERPQMRIALFAGLLIEIYLILTRYAHRFDDFIVLAIIILISPFSYFAFRYLQVRMSKIKIFTAIATASVPEVK
jgi:hypothetical protein